MDYFKNTKEEWQKFLNIPEEDIPEKLIIDGKMDYPKWTRIVLDRMDNGRIAWMPNLTIGDYKGKLTGYGVCFGGPVASQFTHIYCKMGTKKMIQIGCGGGMQPEIELGDIIVSEGVLCMDGVSGLYKQESDFIEFDKNLIGDVTNELQERGIPYHVGKTVCIYDILLWEKDNFMDLSNKGYIGSDMESGAVGSVSKNFNVPAVSFYVCSDNSASGKDLFYKQSDEEMRCVRRGFDTVLDMALDV